MAKKKRMNQYILSILCIVAIVAFVLFVTGRTSFVYVSESDLSGESYSAISEYKKAGMQCGIKDCAVGEKVTGYYDKTGNCNYPPCSSFTLS